MKRFFISMLATIAMLFTPIVLAYEFGAVPVYTEAIGYDHHQPALAAVADGDINTLTNYTYVNSPTLNGLPGLATFGTGVTPDGCPVCHRFRVSGTDEVSLGMKRSYRSIF